MFNSIFLIHFVTTLLMTGLIWVIQLVHYPSFLFINQNSFVAFEKFHSKQISLIVLPLMLTEIATAIILIFKGSAEFKPVLITNFVFLVLIWSVTFFYSASYHKQLLLGFDLELINKLIQTNWYRTILWSLRALILVYLLQKITVNS